MQKNYRIKLAPDERKELTALSSSAKSVSARKVTKARALLLADESGDGPALNDREVMEATGIKPATLVRLRKRTCEVGPLAALERKAQASPSRAKVIGGEAGAKLTQIACSEAPGGRSRWTLRLLADKLVELEVVDAVSHETVRAELKKTTSSRG
jgi:hypothetical protein